MDAKLAAPPTDEDSVRESFAAASGIQRNDAGDFTVAQSEVKKGPTGEQILKEAVAETKKEQTTPVKSAPTAVRSSLASISKAMPKASPAKLTGEETKAGRSTPGLARVGGATGATAGRLGRTTATVGAAQTAKQKELAAK